MKNKIIQLFLLFILLFSLTSCKKEKEKDNDKTYYINYVYFNDIGKKTVYHPVNTVITKPEDPKKDGCLFLGWFYDMNYENKVKFPIVLTENTTIFAAWSSALGYELDPISNTYTVTIGSYGLDKLVIPSTYNDLPVTKIGENAFENRPELVEIVLPDTITEIMDGAFNYCTKLKKINIPDSVKKLGVGVFDGCEELEYESLNGLKYLGNWLIDAKNAVMSRTAFKESTIGIASGAFLENQNIDEIIIPSKVTEIYKDTFKESSITKLVIHENVSYINLSSLDYASNLLEIVVDENNKNYKSINGILYNKDVTKLLIYPSSRTNYEYVMPDSVCEIGEKALRENKNLVKIQLSDNLIKIHDYAFSGSRSLTEITLNDKLEYIGTDAFRNCSKVKDLFIPSSVKEIKEGALYNMNSLSKLSVPFLYNEISEYSISYLFGGIIPNSIEKLDILGGNKITKNSLKGIKTLTELSIPASIAVIEEDSFSDLSLLNKLTIDKNNENYKLIGSTLYSKDETVLLYYLPTASSYNYYSSVKTKTIYKNAFKDNKYLISIELNNGLEYIGENAFNNLSNLNKLIVPETVIKTGQDICFDTPNVTIYSKLPLRGDEWSEGWNTFNYPTVWNAHFPKFVNVELERYLNVGESYIVTFDLDDAPENSCIVLVSKDPSVATVDGFKVTGITDGIVQLELYVEGYYEYKCVITLYIGNI